MGKGILGPILAAVVFVVGFHSFGQTDEPLMTPEPLPGSSPLLAAGVVAAPMPIAPVTPAGPSLAAANDMIGFTRELASGNQAITLINASRKWMAVYHVDQAGQIHLVSSRPLDADFSFQFNATAPLPEEIRKLQGR